MNPGHTESKLKLDLLSRRPLMLNIDHQVNWDFFRWTHNLQMIWSLNNFFKWYASARAVQQGNFMLTMFYVNNGN